MLILKYSIYLYVISGISLALFTLHWQEKLPLSLSSPQSSNQAQVNANHGDTALLAQNVLISLSANVALSTDLVEGRQWLVLVDNGQVEMVFSSKETATILTLSHVYNCTAVVLIASLLWFLFSVKGYKLRGAIAVTMALILLSQQFFDWSLMFNHVIVSSIGLAASSYMWLFMVLSLMILSFLCLIMAKVADVVHSDSCLADGDDKIESLIAYASQSGTAASIAKTMAKLLPQTSRYHVACVSSLRAHQLREYQQVFLLASTYGDGEPPEQAMSFVSSLQKIEQPLTTVKYAVLALGDREYPKFCAFGHQLAATLQQKGAQALLPVAEIHQGHELSIQLWWQQLTHLLGWHSSTLEKTWQKQQVITNHCLNPKVLERPAHHLRLTATDCEYLPGDLLEVMPEVDPVSLREKIIKQGWSPTTMVSSQNKTLQFSTALQQLYWQDESANSPQALVDKLPELTARTYSIASCKEQGVLDLLVRKVIKNDNSIGLCSGYLTQLQPQQGLNVCIKTHGQFHPPSVETPIIMIAAGTGLAPFIGFLEQRQRAVQRGKSWLIMGERCQLDDDYFEQALTEFERSGALDKRQHAWSRSELSTQANYVAEIIAAEQDDMRHWLLELNAQLYICGNAATLGMSCDKILTEILGSKLLAKLKQQQQIKYDLY